MSVHCSPAMAPAVLCPTCTRYMRLSEMTVDADHRQNMRYSCLCGFEYSQSVTSPGERQRAL